MPQKKELYDFLSISEKSNVKLVFMGFDFDKGEENKYLDKKSSSGF